MDPWSALRMAGFGLCLGVAVLAPEAFIASMAVRAALASLGASGLGAEERIFMDEQRFQQEKSLRDIDERSRQFQHERDIEMLHQLEDFWYVKPDV
jgi:hypothetical protein